MKKKIKIKQKNNQNLTITLILGNYREYRRIALWIFFKEMIRGLVKSRFDLFNLSRFLTRYHNSNKEMYGKRLPAGRTHWDEDYSFIWISSTNFIDGASHPLTIVCHETTHLVDFAIKNKELEEEDSHNIIKEIVRNFYDMCKEKEREN